MKIGIVAFSGIYPINIGGPASVGYFVAKWLGALGNDVTLFVRAKTQEQVYNIQELGEFKSLKNVNVVPIVIDYNVKTLMNLPYLAYKVCDATNRFNREKFDIVFYNSPPVDAALFFPIMSKRKREKQTLAIHGGILLRREYAVTRALIKIEKGLFDAVIAVSDFSRKLAREAGFEEDKIIVIPNGVDLEVMSKSKPLDLSGEPKILYVGRLERLKNVDVLLRAFAEVIKEFPKASLYLVGDGPSRVFYEQMAEKLRIRDKVVFKGFVPTTTVYRYYKSVEVSVLPSYVENLSISLLESMASKVPIIASDAEGNTDVISDGRNGLIFPKGNHKILSEKIQFLLSNSNSAQELAANAYEEVKKKYRWKVISLLYYDVFKSLVA